MDKIRKTVEPSAIWSTRLIVFDNGLSVTQNAVLSQGRFALLSMIKRIDYLYSILNFMPQLIDTYVHPDVPEVLTEICLHQGIASNIMFNDSERAHSESATAYRLRLERYQYVKGHLDEQGLSAPILHSRKVRNQLIHIDEHLVKAMGKPNTGWFIDVAIAFRDQYTTENGIGIGFCRTFIASEEVILHLDSEISVRGLRAEATAVLAVVFGNPPTAPPPAPLHSRQNLRFRAQE